MKWLGWTIAGVVVVVAGLCGARIVVEKVKTEKMLDGLEKEYQEKHGKQEKNEADIYKLAEENKQERKEEEKKADELLTGEKVSIGDEEILS